MPAKGPRVNKAAEAKRAERWNRHYPVGTPVLVRKDDGHIFATKTLSGAIVAPSGLAVIFVERIAGFYLLKRVGAVEAFK